MLENTDQKNSKCGHFLLSVRDKLYLLLRWKQSIKLHLPNINISPPTTNFFEIQICYSSP